MTRSVAYNRTVKATGLILSVAFLLVGCAKDIQSKEAVRQGVIDHLSGRAGLDLGSMNIEVTSVTFRGDEADATVSFQAKGANDPASGMQMQYTLERKGNRWAVKAKAGAGGGMHGEGGMMPENPHGAGEAPSGDLPPGHPPTGQGKNSGGAEQ